MHRNQCLRRQKKLVTPSPIFAGQLSITRAACDSCDTTIDSTLPIPPFFRLPLDLQDFVLIFLRCEGKIREVEKVLGISYLSTFPVAISAKALTG